MKEGLKWHDGSDLTAEDVAWSIETAALAPIVQPLVATTIGRIEGAVAYKAGEADSISGISVDGRTVTLTFATIDPNMLM